MENEWLNLKDTAELLGVHPATVRAWGDKGDLPMQRTPGGHRRFRRSDVLARSELNQPRVTGAQIVIQNMVGRARMALTGGSLNRETWYQRLDAQARQQHAEIGRQLLTVVSDYVCDQLTETAVLDKATQIGEAYERLGRENDLTLAETARAFLYFREFLTQTVFDMTHASGPQAPTDWGEIRRQINYLTNEILLAIIHISEERQHE